MGSARRVFRRAMFAGALTAAASTAASAQGPTVKAVFEAHGLMGVWALDCGTAASADNPYVVFRPLETYVQRDTMVGAQDRADASIVEFAALARPNEIAMRVANDDGRLELVVRVEPTRIRTLEIASESGEKTVADGRVVADNAEVPWMNKCSP